MAVFADWQPRYAEHGIATFPVGANKVPAVKGYLKLGSRVSEQLVIKFPTVDAIGLACKRNKITVLDVDAPDEKLLADALDEHGPTPFIVRSGSGNFQAWYRHNGETRKVRPDAAKPIDILGDGFVVAPPSQGAKGAYSLIEGSLDDLDRLPKMKGVVRPKTPSTVDLSPTPAREIVKPEEPVRIGKGQRNKLLWEHCMRTLAEGCSGVEALMESAMEYGRANFYEPLPADEVLRVIASALDTHGKGNNWFNRGNRVVVNADEIDNLMQASPDAFLLLQMLRRHNWKQTDVIVANAMAERMPGGWTRKRFAAARKHLVDCGELIEVKAASSYYGPAIYKFKGGQI